MSRNKYIVYCHKNKTNGFEYIGMTGRSLKARWSGKILSYVSCKNFENALREYGWDGFEHLVLFSGLTKEEAAKKETELILENIAKGVSYNIRVDDNWIGDIRKRRVNIYELSGRLIDTCESIHEASVKYKTSETHAFYCACGKKKTVHNKYLFAFDGEDISLRLKEAIIDRRYNTPAHNRRKVKMMSLDGEEIRVFDSVTGASDFVGASLGAIVSSCKGINKTCRGYKWQYV